MKSLFALALTSSTLLLSTSVIAAKPITQGEAFSQCKVLANAQFDNVKRVKLAHMKNTRGQFKIKLRVTAKADKGMFLCTVERDQVAQIVRLDKDANSVATKQQ